MDSILRGETGNIRQGRTSRETQRKAKGSARTHKTPSWPQRSHAYQRNQVGTNPGRAPSYSAKGASQRRKSSLKSPRSRRKLNREWNGHASQLMMPTTTTPPRYENIH